MRLILRISHRSSGIVDLDGAVVPAWGCRLRGAGYLPGNLGACRTRAEKDKCETSQREHSSEE